jgi:arsenate reductase-like glutaredoxin family protein
MKAREFLAQGKRPFEMRDLIKKPLTLPELRALAVRAGGAAELVAPKQRKEAEGLDEEALLAWLAEDGRRLRRPIIDTGEILALGFTSQTRELLATSLD